MAIQEGSSGIVSDMAFVDALVNPCKYVVLTGSCLPFRGLRFGGSSKIHVQDYQGSNYVHINVFNPIETDLVIKGRWNGAMIDGVGSEIEYGTKLSPKKLSDDMKSDPFLSMMNFCRWMDEWRASGPLITFSWYGINRRGLIQSFEYEIDDTNYISWEMTVKWESYKQVEGKSNIIELAGPAAVGMDWASKFKSLVGLLEQALGLDPLQGAYGPNIPIISDIFDIMRDIDTQVKRFNDAVSSAERMNELISSAAMTPLDIVTNVLNAISNMQGALDRMSDIWEQNAVSHMNAMEYAYDSIHKPSWTSAAPGTESSGDFPDISKNAGITAGLIVGSNGLQEVKQSSAGGRLLDVRAGMSSALPFDIREILSEMRADAAIAQNRLRKFSVDYENIMDMYIAEEQMHIGVIAVKYYGSWSNWPRLADYNSIVSPLLDAGRVIVIPKVL